MGTVFCNPFTLNALAVCQKQRGVDLVPLFSVSPLGRKFVPRIDGNTLLRLSHRSASIARDPLKKVPNFFPLAVKTYDLPLNSRGNLFRPAVSNARRTRATSHPCERGADLLEDQSNPQEVGVARFNRPANLRRKTLWRCAMSHNSRTVSETTPKQSLGSLGGCLVEGDPEQRSRERRIRRRSLVFSILTQAAVVALLVLLPLFGKTERIALAVSTPIPPYSPYRGPSRDPGVPHPHGRQQTVCHFCIPHYISPIIVTHDPPTGGTDDV